MAPPRLRDGRLESPHDTAQDGGSPLRVRRAVTIPRNKEWRRRTYSPPALLVHHFARSALDCGSASCRFPSRAILDSRSARPQLCRQPRAPKRWLAPPHSKALRAKRNYHSASEILPTPVDFPPDLPPPLASLTLQNTAIPYIERLLPPCFSGGEGGEAG
jgi:hypothetical protein